MSGGRGTVGEKPAQIMLWICTIGTVAGLWMTGANRQLQNREKKKSLDDKLKELDSIPVSSDKSTVEK
ncbi:hypothetical protein SUGI_0097170 [Cryptomeria japonica]|nr:hypothetical protein SUGI_0097170 [Cryptomeria japonica]